MLMEVYIALNFLKGNLRIHTKNFNMCISFDPPFSPLGIYHKEIIENVKKRFSYKNCGSKNWKQLNIQKLEAG